MSQDPHFLDSPRLREHLVAELTHPAGAAPAPIDPRAVDYLLDRIRENRGTASAGGYEEFRQSTARLVMAARRIALAQRGSRRVRLGDVRAAHGRYARSLWPFG